MADAVLALLVPWGLLVGCWVVIMSLWVGMWWRIRRDLRRGDERHAAYTREQELKCQLREMEAQIREERLSEEAREWRRRSREEQAKIQREAWRRLGLPEEEPRG
jgi:hypothetical protein